MLPPSSFVDALIRRYPRVDQGLPIAMAGEPEMA